MNSTRPHQVVSNLFQGLVFIVGAVGVALTVWLWGKRRSERSQLSTENENSSDSKN